MRPSYVRTQGQAMAGKSGAVRPNSGSGMRGAQANMARAATTAAPRARHARARVRRQAGARGRQLPSRIRRGSPRQSPGGQRSIGHARGIPNPKCLRTLVMSSAPTAPRKPSIAQRQCWSSAWTIHLRISGSTPGSRKRGGRAGGLWCARRRWGYRGRVRTYLTAERCSMRAQRGVWRARHMEGGRSAQRLRRSQSDAPPSAHAMHAARWACAAARGVHHGRRQR